MWWILAGCYLVLTALTLWFLYRAHRILREDPDDGAEQTELTTGKSRTPRDVIAH